MRLFRRLRQLLSGCEYEDVVENINGMDPYQEVREYSGRLRN